MINNTTCTPVSSPEPNPEADEAGQPPRRRGAPRGNQNARTHGFYSRQTTRNIRDRLRRYGGLSILDRELYVAFIQAQMVVKNAPHNDAVLSKTINALVDHVCRKYDLDQEDTERVMAAIQRVGEELTSLEADRALPGIPR
ncbi:MAG: hypothetical protein ACRKGH_02450 [Dehalogenimonas sp.]